MFVGPLVDVEIGLAVLHESKSALDTSATLCAPVAKLKAVQKQGLHQ